MSLSACVYMVCRTDCVYRVITTEAGRELANEWKAVFVEASAKQNEVCRGCDHRD